jgi:hypothetical protein
MTIFADSWSGSLTAYQSSNGQTTIVIPESTATSVVLSGLG